MHGSALLGRALPKSWRHSAGPCASDVNYVITYEELMGIFAARDIDFSNEAELSAEDAASSTGRNYAVSGGVAAAVVSCIKRTHPDKEVLIDRAEGLANCKRC